MVPNFARLLNEEHCIEIFLCQIGVIIDFDINLFAKRKYKNK